MIMENDSPRKKHFTVRVSAGSEGVKAGALRVLDALAERINSPELPINITVNLGKTGVLGFYQRDTLVQISSNGVTWLYAHITPDMAARLVNDHIIGGNPIAEWLADDDWNTFQSKQERALTGSWPSIDPDDIATYLENGGYKAARQAFTAEPGSVIKTLEGSGLRERALEGMPVFFRWRSARGKATTLIALADSGDPQSFVARDILESCPHAVIEGMLIGARALGASKGTVIVRQGYTLAADRMRRAIKQAREHGLLGANALQSGFDFDLECVSGPNAPICPSGAVQTDGDYRDAVIHDAETWINIPPIIGKGREWYPRHNPVRQTKLWSLTGAIPRQGLVEIPLGTPLYQLIYDVGGRSYTQAAPRMIHAGGPYGGLLSSESIDTPLNYEDLAEVLASFGSGSVHLPPEQSCVVLYARDTLLAYLDETKGVCERRERRGRLERILRLITEILEGMGTVQHLSTLENTCLELQDKNLCGTNRSGGSFVLSTLRHFHEEYLTHAREKKCPAATCFRMISAPCQQACPAGIDIPSYLALVGHGKYEEAVELIRKDNPFVWTCGLICPAPCESVCVRAEMDRPISIRAMKGFAASKGFDAYEDKREKPPAPEGPLVAVIGSGPGGLTCAYYLALKGYRVTVFEALAEAGGLLRMGIPEYRLPKEIVRKEIDHIRSYGVRIETNTAVGRDLTIDDLRERGFKAIFIAVGAHKGYSLNIEGEDQFQGVYDSIGFLRDVSLNDMGKPADKAVIIGGGNAAVDAARTCVRLGCSRVIMAYRRTREEMPAWEEEIVQAVDEGVELNYLTIPVRVLGENGVVTGLECLQAALGEPDVSGRRRPIPVKGSNFTIEAGAIITAIGQGPDLSGVNEADYFEVSRRGSIDVDPNSMQTSAPDVFAGGDVVTGPATVVAAIGAGKLAAEAIDRYLRGEKLPSRPREKAPRASIEPIFSYYLEKQNLKRSEIPLVPLDVRKNTFQQVELGLTREMALNEAKRCLRCDMCAGQGLCQMVCKEMGVEALKMIPANADRLVFNDFARANEMCVGCGSCANVCPTGNMWIKDEDDVRKVYCCGSLIKEFKLVRCEECGKPVASREYLDLLKKRMEGSPGVKSRQVLCEECARRVWANRMVGGALR